MIVNQRPKLREIGIAAGLVAMFLFGVLYGTTGHPAALIAGCGGGFLLLITAVLAGQAQERSR